MSIFSLLQTLKVPNEFPSLDKSLPVKATIIDVYDDFI